MLNLRQNNGNPRDQATLRMRAARKHLGNCRQCNLCSGRKKIVFGAGNPVAPILVVGGAPGYYEDKEGLPLAGKAGQIFQEAVSRVGLSVKRDIFATNIVKCRPPRRSDDSGQTLPVLDEHLDSCKPYLDWQMDIVKPAIIVLHGKRANQGMLGDQRSLSQYAGHWRIFGDKCIALSTHNPAGFFGDRANLMYEYFNHWEELALRLNLLGRLWRPDAEAFASGWTYSKGDLDVN